MVSAGSAEYDPPKTPKGQLPRAALIYWKRPEEWAALIYDWVSFRTMAKQMSWPGLLAELGFD